MDWGRMADCPVAGGEVDARSTITIEIEWSRLLVIGEKYTNGACQMHAEGPVYIHADAPRRANATDDRLHAVIPRRGRQLLERNEWRQLIWQADQFAIRRQTIC